MTHGAKVNFFSFRLKHLLGRKPAGPKETNNAHTGSSGVYGRPVVGDVGLQHSPVMSKRKTAFELSNWYHVMEPSAKHLGPESGATLQIKRLRPLSATTRSIRRGQLSQGPE
jgi:hypothetical protein